MTRTTLLALALVAFCIVACSDEPDWVQISSGPVTADLDIGFGDQEVIGRGCEDGAIVGTACFDPPVVPVGSFNWLKINGKDISLEKTELEDGLLRTKDFGNIRILISRTDRIDVYVQGAQVKRLEDYGGIRLVSSPVD